MARSAGGRVSPPSARRGLRRDGGHEANLRRSQSKTVYFRALIAAGHACGYLVLPNDSGACRPSWTCLSWTCFPKHGSWLNIAENELSSMTRQCIQGRRIADIATLRDETSARASDVNETQRGVDWEMRIDDARTKLKSVYSKIKL